MMTFCQYWSVHSLCRQLKRPGRWRLHSSLPIGLYGLESTIAGLSDPFKAGVGGCPFTVRFVFLVPRLTSTNVDRQLHKPVTDGRRCAPDKD